MTPDIALNDITLGRNGRRVLDGLSLRLMPGERIGLCGPNGAGKTTLLRVIAGLARPDAGTITLHGRPCRTEADFRRARPALGFLFQESDDQLFAPTVIEDVAFGPLNLGFSRPAAIARAHAQLADLGLDHLSDRPVHHLSGGEKRLVCLAGLFAMDPRVLLLDEPTAALDAVAAATLTDRLHRFAGAMIIATHDPALLETLNARPLLLTAGRLA